MSLSKITDVITCCHCHKTFQHEIPYNSTVELGKVLLTQQGGDDDGKTIEVSQIKCPRCQSSEVYSVDL